MNIILFEDHTRSALLPFTFTRPVAAIRFGILTMGEKWEKHFGVKVSFLTQDYLSEKFPLKTASDNLLINFKVLSNMRPVDSIGRLKQGETLVNKGVAIAIRTANRNLRNISSTDTMSF